MDKGIIKENDLIFLILDERRRWLVEVKSGDSFHTHRGIIEFDDIIGKSFGSCVFSKPYETQGYKFYILKPLPSDYILYMSRKTQIIYPEDAGLILIYSGIGPGSTILEAGCGSGALTCILGNYVQPNGHIYAYDIREKSLKRTRRNIERAKLSDSVTIQYGNIIEDSLNHKNLDAVVLDMAQPWKAIDKVKVYLKLSGVVASFSPSIEQVKETTSAMKNNGFYDIKSYELIKRKIQVKNRATHPEVRMIGHTGYITFGRAVEDIENPYRSKKPKYEEFVDLDGMPLRS